MYSFIVFCVFWELCGYKKPSVMSQTEGFQSNNSNFERLLLTHQQLFVFGVATRVLSEDLS